MVLLVTSDNEQFNADKEVVERSVLIKNMLEGMCWPQLSCVRQRRERDHADFSFFSTSRRR